MRNRRPIRRHAAYSADEILDAMDAAIDAMGGDRTSIEQGSPEEILDDEEGYGDPYEVEVVATVAQLGGTAGMANALPYNTIEWGGWVDARIYDGKLQISAMGGLAFDGEWKDASKRIGDEYYVLRGEYDLKMNAWEWYSDSM